MMSSVWLEHLAGLADVFVVEHDYRLDVEGLIGA
jgi:hypothetical protein